jgi:hypothetical protein
MDLATHIFACIGAFVEADRLYNPEKNSVGSSRQACPLITQELRTAFERMCTELVRTSLSVGGPSTSGEFISSKEKVAYLSVARSALGSVPSLASSEGFLENSEVSRLRRREAARAQAITATSEQTCATTTTTSPNTGDTIAGDSSSSSSSSSSSNGTSATPPLLFQILAEPSSDPHIQEEGLKLLALADPAAVSQPSLRDGTTALHIAASSAATSPAVLRRLLQLESRSVRTADARGRLPLHWALDSAYPSLEKVQVLLEAFTHAASRSDYGGLLPLHVLAAASSSPQGFFGAGRVGMLPWGTTVEQGRQERQRVLELLLRQAPDAPRVRCHARGYLPLHYASDSPTPCPRFVAALLAAHRNGATTKATSSRELPLHMSLKHVNATIAGAARALQASADGETAAAEAAVVSDTDAPSSSGGGDSTSTSTSTSNSESIPPAPIPPPPRTVLRVRSTDTIGTGSPLSAQVQHLLLDAYPAGGKALRKGDGASPLLLALAAGFGGAHRHPSLLDSIDLVYWEGSRARLGGAALAGGSQLQPQAQAQAHLALAAAGGHSRMVWEEREVSLGLAPAFASMLDSLLRIDSKRACRRVHRAGLRALNILFLTRAAPPAALVESLATRCRAAAAACAYRAAQNKLEARERRRQQKALLAGAFFDEDEEEEEEKGKGKAVLGSGSGPEHNGEKAEEEEEEGEEDDEDEDSDVLEMAEGTTPAPTGDLSLDGFTIPASGDALLSPLQLAQARGMGTDVLAALRKATLAQLGMVLRDSLDHIVEGETGALRVAVNAPPLIDAFARRAGTNPAGDDGAHFDLYRTL